MKIDVMIVKKIDNNFKSTNLQKQNNSNLSHLLESSDPSNI